MKKFQRAKRFAGLLIALGLLAPTGQIHAYNPEYIKNVGDEALKAYSLIGEEQAVEKEATLPTEFGDFFKALAKPYESTFVIPAERAMLQQAFEQLPLEELPLKQEVIDQGTVKELELLRGGTRAEDSLINRITETTAGSYLSTIIGRKSMIEAISMPVDDMDLVASRQEAIKVLIDRPVIRNRCYALLQKMRAAEPYFFDMYKKDGLTKPEEMLYPSPLLQLLGLGEVPGAVTFANRMTSALVPFIGATAVAEAAFAAKYPNVRAVMGLYSGYSALMVTVLAGQRKAVTHMIKNMQERLINVATFVRSSQALLQFLTTQKGLAGSLPELKTALELVQVGSRASSKFNYLIKLLRKGTFDEGAPSAWSSPGNVLVAYKYMVDKSVRAEFTPLMKVVGQIDSYVALAQKMVAHKDLPAKFCFAEFETGENTPILDAQNFWNPFIDPQVVVPNSVSLGTGNERNLLISGPNTGGKSTIMKALMMNVLMAQTYGIAPAESLRFTPFSKLITYLNIADDTGAGISLFKAEVKRASELMATLEALPANQFAFVMIDEIFTGTAPDKAELLSHQFMSKLSTFKNVIFVNATHFKRLTDLEKETGGQVKNYHTGVITDDAGRVVKYTYQLVPGPNVVSSAQQVAEESGIQF